MAAPARFMFDLDFAAPPPKPAPAEPVVPMIAEAEHHALLAQAEKAAYERGLKEGRDSSEAKSANRLADEAQRLAHAAQSILAALDGEQLRIEAEAMRLAEAVGRKIAGALIDREPRALILAVIEEAMMPLRKAPHLVVRLASADSDPIRSELTRIASERGFEGRLVVLPEPGMARGDCRIEWADGGIVLDRAATEAAIDRAIANHLTLATGEPLDAGDTP